jgi:hypothetical protein
MEVIMRIRRTILAPVILAIGTTGVLAVTAAAIPASAVAVGSATPNMVVYRS